MAKYSVVFDDSGVALKATDGKAKPFNEAFVSGVDLVTAMGTTKQEIQGRGELTRSMLSILVQVLIASPFALYLAWRKANLS